MNDILRAYRGEAWNERLHVWFRARSCPFDAVETRVPRHGRILDLGCGHGLFSLILGRARERDVVGVDIDADKLGVARRAAARAGLTNVRFESVAPGFVPSDGWDAVCLVDVLYLLGHEPARQLLRSASAALNPSGVLLVKEIDLRPRWKYELARFQELAATRLLRITEGRQVAFLPPNEIATEMAAGGLVVERVSLQRHRLHPHHLVVGRAG